MTVKTLNFISILTLSQICVYVRVQLSTHQELPYTSFTKQKDVSFIRIKASKSNIPRTINPSLLPPVVLTAHNVRLTQYLESSWQVLLYNYCATLTRALTAGLVAGGARGIRGARS